jgi:hypothetical protein
MNNLHVGPAPTVPSEKQERRATGRSEVTEGLVFFTGSLGRFPSHFLKKDTFLVTTRVPAETVIIFPFTLMIRKTSGSKCDILLCVQFCFRRTKSPTIKLSGLVLKRKSAAFFIFASFLDQL